MQALVVTSMGSAAFKQYLVAKLSPFRLQCKRITPGEAESNDYPGYDLMVLSKAEVNGKAAVIRERAAKYGVPVLEFHHKHGNPTFEEELAALKTKHVAPPPVIPPAPMRGTFDATKPVEIVEPVAEPVVVEEPAATAPTAIQLFDFKGSTVRVTVDPDGEPQWIAKDVCDVLGISNPSDSLSGLDDDEKGRFTDLGTTESGGIPRTYATVTEAGLYSLILRSRKPNAKEFRRWVTHEVLPALRGKGFYINGEGPKPKHDEQIAMLEALLANAKAIAGHDADFARFKAAVVKDSAATQECLEALSELDKARGQEIAAERKAREEELAKAATMHALHLEAARKDMDTTVKILAFETKAALEQRDKAIQEALAKAEEAHTKATTRASEAMAQEKLPNESPMGTVKKAKLMEELHLLAEQCARDMKPPTHLRAAYITWASSLAHSQVRIVVGKLRGSFDTMSEDTFEKVMGALTPGLRRQIVAYCEQHRLPDSYRNYPDIWATTRAARW